MRRHFSRRPEDSIQPGGGRHGLVSSWSLSVRFAEERYRADRFDRPLALLVVEPIAGSPVAERSLRDWLLYGHLRMSDVARRQDDGSFAILLPETNGHGANSLAARLRREVPDVLTGISVYSQDGETMDILIAAARDSLSLNDDDQEAS